jgi:transcriptional regulator with XRE-family HTH domain
VTLGNAIKLIRTARGMSQRDLAPKLNISANYLSLVEGDKRDPSLAVLKRISVELKVPVAMLFMLQGEVPPGVPANDMHELKDVIVRLNHLIVAKKEP